MKEKIVVISTYIDYVAETVAHQLQSMGKGLDVTSIDVDHIDKELHGKWDYAILLNHSIALNDSRLHGNVLRVVEMEFPNPENDEECAKVDAAIRRRIIEFYLNDIEGREMLGADSCGAFCDL